jgi:cobalamin biosynthesis protein CobW
MGNATTSIPILVVSGFLGSGKTTLVRDLLEQAQRAGERLAILTNEFGALGIDEALLRGTTARRVELEGGCICCELSDEMVDELEKLRVEVQPDRIVIETSGAALPYDVQLSLWRPPVSEWAGDDMAAVVVNAEQLAEGRDLGETFAQQVSAADLLILNQIDRVATASLDALEAQLQEREPEVPIVRACHAQVDPSLLVPPALDLKTRELRRREVPATHHHEAFESEVVDFPGVVEEAVVRGRLAKRDVLRAKGFVRTPEGIRVVQGVGRRLELAEVRGAPPPDPLVGRVVVIARPGEAPLAQ